jgi:hypothetical protein
MISERNQLQQLFAEVVPRSFNLHLPLRDPEIQDYVVNLLCAFCECDELLKIHNVQGRPLDDVGEMLLEADPIFGQAPSFDRERQVRKHIGDYTLFFTGMFPESINHSRLRRHRLESLVDIVKAGKESYNIVSKFDQFEYKHVSPLFAKLSREFENCIYGVNLVRCDLDTMRHHTSRPVPLIC